MTRVAHTHTHTLLDTEVCGRALWAMPECPATMTQRTMGDWWALGKMNIFKKTCNFEVKSRLSCKRHQFQKHPPTSLSIERVRACDQPTSPSAIKLTPLNSDWSSASKPASTPSAWLLACKPAGSHTVFLRGPRSAAKGRHRLPQVATGDPSL